MLGAPSAELSFGWDRFDHGGLDVPGSNPAVGKQKDSYAHAIRVTQGVIFY